MAGQVINGNGHVFDQDTGDWLGVLNNKGSVQLVQSSVSGDSSQRVVFLGSSGAAGVGSSGYTTDPGLGGVVSATSWAGLWGAELTAQDFTVINESISGTGTTASLARFEDAVVRHSPTHVVLGTGIQNDGFFESPTTAARAYVRNTLKLVAKCHAIGAVPIVGTGVTPARTWGLNHLRWARWVLAQFERYSLPTINFLDPLLTRLAGQLLASYSVDDYHLNDAGHAMIFKSVPPTFMKSAGVGVLRPQFSRGRTAINNDGGSAIPMQYRQSVASRNFGGWTVAMAFVGAPSVGTGKAFFFGVGNGATDIRVRNPGGVYELIDSAGVVITSSVSTTDTAQHILVVSKSQADGWVDFWIDGVNIGTSTAFTSIAQDQWGFDFFGRFDSLSANAANVGITGIGVWRCSHISDMLASMSRGFWPTASAEILTDDLMDTPSADLPNRARSSEFIRTTAAVAFTLA